MYQHGDPVLKSMITILTWWIGGLKVGSTLYGRSTPKDRFSLFCIMIQSIISHVCFIHFMYISLYNVQAYILKCSFMYFSSRDRGRFMKNFPFRHYKYLRHYSLTKRTTETQLWQWFHLQIWRDKISSIVVKS